MCYRISKIKQNYLSTDHDRMVAARGLKLTRKIILESETFKKSLIMAKFDVVESDQIESLSASVTKVFDDALIKMHL